MTRIIFLGIVSILILQANARSVEAVFCQAEFEDAKKTFAALSQKEPTYDNVWSYLKLTANKGREEAILNQCLLILKYSPDYHLKDIKNKVLECAERNKESALVTYACAQALEPDPSAIRFYAKLANDEGVSITMRLLSAKRLVYLGAEKSVNPKIIAKGFLVRNRADNLVAQEIVAKIKSLNPTRAKAFSQELINILKSEGMNQEQIHSLGL